MDGRITLNGRYEIIDKIGGGGMAEVFHGYDAVLHRDVGIKILRDQFIQDKQFVARFRQEACNAAGLSHPNIVNIYDCGNEHDIYYIVMEYVVGRSLKEVIEDNGPLDCKTAVRYAIGIASALKQAHDHAIVHCDVKSQNILIDTKGVAKITDFGIARAFGQQANSSQEKNVLGSVYYLSPEQAAGQPVTPQSDLYSLGVVLFEMLTGKLPYDGNTPMEVARQHLESTTPSARRYDPDIPYYLDNIITKALAKNPKLRYASAEDFLRDLKKAQTHLLGEAGYLGEDWEQPPVPKQPVSEETMVISKAEMLDGLMKAQPARNQVPPYVQKEPAAKPAAKTEPPKGPFGSKKMMGVFIGAILALCAIIYFMVGYQTGDLTVPDVTNKTVVEAEAILTKADLGFTLTEAYSATVQPGYIIKQDPKGHSKVKKGRKIHLTVSKGSEPGIVPDVKKKSLAEATVMLEKAKLKVGSVSVKADSSVPKGAVVSQSIAPNKKVEPGTSVDLVVNISGSQSEVPSLEGLSLAEAKSKLSKMGLVIGQLSETNSDKAKGTVLSSSPEAGEVVEKGSSVSLTVSAGKKEEKKPETNTNGARTRTITYTVPGKGAPKNVKIVASDAAGSRTVFSGAVPPGTTITRQVNLGEGANVQIYVNGALAEDKSL